MVVAAELEESDESGLRDLVALALEHSLQYRQGERVVKQSMTQLGRALLCKAWVDTFKMFSRLKDPGFCHLVNVKVPDKYDVNIYMSFPALCRPADT